MKLLLVFVVFVTGFVNMVSANDCPSGFDDCMDVGDANSMSYHNAQGFGMDPGNGDYGRYDGGQSLGVVWESINGVCHENYESAYFLGS